MHVDFNQHSVTRLANRLVFITYLNKDWLPSYGGGLELWDVEKNEPVVEILPEFGRSVLFYQSSKSLHGHPKPVAAPNGRPRRSAAAYFYSNGRSDDEDLNFHTTQFASIAQLPDARQTDERAEISSAAGRLRRRPQGEVAAALNGDRGVALYPQRAKMI